MDNEVSENLKKYFEDSNIQFQLLPPHMHWINAAERALRPFKKHLIAALCTVEPLFLFYLWYRLLPQVTMTLNMLRWSRLNAGLSAYEQVDVIHNFEQTPLAPLGCKVQIHEHIISNSPTLPTQLMDGTLDQQYIVIDVTNSLTLILEGKLHQIQ